MLICLPNSLVDGAVSQAQPTIIFVAVANEFGKVVGQSSFQRYYQFG
jgi:hypothetical protein